ncbi:type VII secretion protein EccCa [Planosporangium thailandense]|uniref:Type VII secretion protein EccCa n=1 Tax=Planosporangium thailandense TaxID=765197 RepID=A0ABX0Y3M2_9ACTN|nr:type VII secretion protein EccCa [Planosporangium thailandense]NJC72027.1 type VII secretion protein EccCa [Planosporangium thailandense]
MVSVPFRRPPRQSIPDVATGEIVIQEPPVLPEPQSSGMGGLLMALPMAAGSGATALFFLQPGSNHTVGYAAAGLMAVSSLGMVVSQLGRGGSDQKRRMRGERRDYLRYLSQLRRRVRTAAAQQRTALTWQHPDPAALWSVAMSRRLWERRITDPDFGEVRLGLGAQRLAVRLSAPQTKPVEDLEPLSARALRRFIRAYRSVDGVPVSAYLPSFARVLLRGDDATRCDLARALLAQLATLHSPEDLQIAVCASAERQPEWEWVKWLPHAGHPRERDAAGPVRLFADEIAAMEDLLGGDAFRERPRFDPQARPVAGEPYVVILLDGVRQAENGRMSTAGYRHCTVIDVADCLPWRDDQITLRLRATPGRLESVTGARPAVERATPVATPDALDAVRCRVLGQNLAPFRMGGSVESAAPLSTDIELTALLGVGDPRTLDPSRTWAPRSTWDQLRVPIGVTETGAPVELDIKEAARGGMGPHGMLIGATGSGKSELLRTLVLALAITHSSEILNFILVDFKGGATFLGLESLPHTSAVITNLADELPLVDRMHDAISGEVTRRQELLRRAGNYSSAYDYERARADGAPLDPLPTLFLVVDEFSELLATKREFIDLFVMIGRLGRSLGIHLLLASQRLDEGRINALESHLSYRIGLRTFSASESRAVLGVPDAYQLPSAPGNGYLRTDTSTLIRFKAAYVSGATRTARPARPPAVVAQQVVEYRPQAAPVTAAPPPPEPLAPPAEAPASRESMLSIVVDRLRDQGPAAHQVWLPPLSAPPDLDELLPPIVPHPQYGLQAAEWPGRGALTVPVGLVDRPAEQRRDLLLADLSGGAGHVGITGGAQSGKSTLARTLITALALTHTPREAQFYLLDFGGTLASLRELPHVGAVTGRLDPERVARTLAELAGLLTRREQLFREHEIESMERYRELRRQGRFQDEDPYGDVFLVIDGWFTFHQDFENLEPVVQELAARGLGFGLHLIVTSGRWADVRPWLRNLLGTKFELKLGDSADSEINSRAAAGVPALPGRGLTSERLHFLAGVPRIGGLSRVGSGGATDTLPDDSRALVEAIAEAWSGPGAPPVRLLPPVLPLAELPAPDGDLRVPLGWDEARLQPVWHDFGQHPHLMVFGDSETGKTNLLRLVARAVAGRFSPDEARVMMADTRRELHDAVPTDHQLGYAVSGTALGQHIRDSVEILRQRIPGPEITTERLRRRDWWEGPRLYVVVDDYDLIAHPVDNPLAPLLDLLAHGVEIGLHLVVARTTVGAARVLSDPVVRRLIDLATPSLLLSCGREEGAFLGNVPPRRLPPGRAQLITRRGVGLVQTALVDEAAGPVAG